MIVAKAHNELEAAMLEVMARHELTSIEWLSCLNQIEATTIKYAIREERHPDDPDKRGGEE